MKKKIFATMIILTMITTIISGLLVTGVYYKFYLSQAKAELQSAANLVIRDSALKEDGLEREDYARIFTDISRSLVYKFRVTVTSSDGEVIYDTDDQGRPLDNHLSRPEIMEAMGADRADGMRLSQTTGKVTYYYALKLDDSVIVRFFERPGQHVGDILRCPSAGRRGHVARDPDIHSGLFGAGEHDSQAGKRGCQVV